MCTHVHTHIYYFKSAIVEGNRQQRKLLLSLATIKNLQGLRYAHESKCMLTNVYACVFIWCMRVSMCVCACICGVHVCMCVCVRLHVCVHVCGCASRIREEIKGY